jgi:hypothetical protein
VIGVFGSFMVTREIRRAFCEAKERKIWTFIVGVMVIRGILFICGQCGQHKKLLQIFFKKIKENCAILDRSISTRKALVHSIPISEVKDIKSDVLQALKASLFEKKLRTLFVGLVLTISRKKNCIDFEFILATFPPLGSIYFLIYLKFVSNFVFPFITYPLLLIDLFEI